MDKGLGNNESNSSTISSSSAATITNNSSNSSITNTNTNTNSNNRDMFLRQMNKNSHKIAKPIRKQALPPPPSILDPVHSQTGPQSSQQPPVYNINKNDFRDVVQKLTGSPAHDRLPTPPTAAQPRPPSSRLQRIRPPPLAQISNRPLNDAVNGQSFPPLPPLPSVHPAAESPISAYMRFLGGGAPVGHRPESLLPPPPAESPISAYMRFLQSSAGSSSAAPPPPGNAALGGAQSQQQPFTAPFPVSPLPFGCVPSPRSPYGMMSPTAFLFSPTGQFGLPQLPLSPTLPVASPRWKGM